MPAVDHVTDITHTIQLAIAPVFLLTALGTMLSVFSARLGRIVDRTRVLGDRVPEAAEDKRAAMLEEMDMLARRRGLVNVAITCATVAALLVCVLIAVAFLGSILQLDSARVVAGLFIAVMGAFITALVFFLREILLAVISISSRKRAAQDPHRPSSE